MTTDQVLERATPEVERLIRLIGGRQVLPGCLRSTSGVGEGVAEPDAEQARIDGVPGGLIEGPSKERRRAIEGQHPHRLVAGPRGVVGGFSWVPGRLEMHRQDLGIGVIL